MGFCLVPIVTLLSKASSGILLFLFLLSCSLSPSTEAYDDPNGNITIKWDVINWTADGYVAVVTMQNFHQYRHITVPGWTLGWTWANKEVIWNMVGAKATEQGNCSRFTGNIPHSCQKNPTIVDLPPSTPYNKKIAHCCKGGVLSSSVQDPTNSVASFQVTVGAAGTTNRTVQVPRNFTLKVPGPGFTCGKAKIVNPTRFITPDKRRVTQAIMTWNVTCTYSQFLVQKNPTCCVSLSSFYNDSIVPCPTCSCGCQGNSSSCVESGSADHLTHLGQCTSLRCPIQVHWRVEDNYKDYWRVKINITNFNYRVNYSDWNLVIQHQNIDNVTHLFGFIHKVLAPDGATNDTAMLWGIKFYNDFLNQAGPSATTIQTELLIGKDGSNMSLEKGWAFPEGIYFNGDNCVMPPSDAYPLTLLPESASFRQEVSLLPLMTMSCLVALVFYTFA
ncbi:hypothetical protein K1719_008487 [Acacia pycnantha]|nr:hypothetical protein K1719_008487 [Acacia pycnantha]